jgi:hypothetical protein
VELAPIAKIHHTDSTQYRIDPVTVPFYNQENETYPLPVWRKRLVSEKLSLDIDLFRLMHPFKLR